MPKHYPRSNRVAAIHKLRVNLKSLVAEAQFIRKEERRCGPEYRHELASHRRTVVRDEQRYTHLALAFLRRRAYRQVEAKCERMPDAERLHKKLANKLGGTRYWEGAVVVDFPESEVRNWLDVTAPKTEDVLPKKEPNIFQKIGNALFR